MPAENEFPSVKLLLKQVYSVHSAKVKELENEIKFLREKLDETNKNSTSTKECERCSDLDETFKTCKKALSEVRCFNKFDTKFSIFNSRTTDISPVKDIPNDTSIENEQALHRITVASEEESVITEKTAVTKKGNAFRHNMFEKIAADTVPEMPDICTITFPENSKADLNNSLVFVPDTLEAHTDCNEDSYTKESEKEKSIPLTESCQGTSELNKVCSDKNSKRILSNKANLSSLRKENGELNLCIEESVKNENITILCDGNDNIKISDSLRNQDKQVTSCCEEPDKNEKHTRFFDGNTCKNILYESSSADSSRNQAHQVTLCQEKLDTYENSTTDRNKYNKRSSDFSGEDSSKNESVPLASANKSKRIKSDENKPVTLSTCKSTDFRVKSVSKGRKRKLVTQPNSSSNVLSKVSPSLLPANAPNLKHVEVVLQDDDFQDGNVPAQNSWESCEKKKSVKPKKSSKLLKCSSKFKMTLDSLPPDYKKTVYKQTKLSKSIFHPKQPKSLDINKENETEIVEQNEIPEIILEKFDTSTPNEGAQPSNFDIDATFMPEGFKYEITQCGTANVKKNSINKKQIVTESLFSAISFPGIMKSPKTSTALRERKKGICDVGNNLPEEIMENSFDRLPAPEEPKYKYKNDTVRKKSERKQLNGFDCKECEKYYSALGISENDKKERMKKCSRHRAKYAAPETPDYFWELEFPNTQECRARGYLNETQKIHLKSLNNLI